MLTKLIPICRFCERYPGRQPGKGEEYSLSGLGIGLLISTAVALSTSLDELVSAGVEVLRIAFRMGVYVCDVSQNLEPTDPASGDRDTWAYVVHGVSAEEAESELSRLYSDDVSQSFVLLCPN